LSFEYVSHPPLDHVFIDKGVSGSRLCQNVVENLRKIPIYKNTKVEVIDDYRSWLSSVQHDIHKRFDKKTLLLYPEKGQFMHHCPGSDSVVCCRYFVLDFGMNCPYDCHYCYLQTYAKVPVLTVAGNVEELLAEVKRKTGELEGIHWRIGTGEYTDSLSLENLTGLGKILVEFFSTLPNATLELKTKSVEIDSLLGLNHKGNTVIAWSLNPDYIVNEVEYHCSSLDRRFEAARKVIEAGYQVAFHFDPVFYYDTWQADYKALVERLFDEIPSKHIRWISLGTFRYSPGLKEKLRLRHPEEFITRAEMILAPDNKFRYMAPLRAKMYKYLSDEILKRDPGMMLYLCMETRATWKRVFNQNLIGPSYLDDAFEKRRLLLK